MFVAGSITARGGTRRVLLDAALRVELVFEPQPPAFRRLAHVPSPAQQPIRLIIDGGVEQQGRWGHRNAVAE